MKLNYLLIGARSVYNKRKMRIISVPPKVKVGLFQNFRFDLSVLLIGSTSSEIGNSERLGFQLTYLSGEKFEKRVFLPCFLKFDHALSQSVDDLSPLLSLSPFLLEDTTKLKGKWEDDKVWVRDEKRWDIKLGIEMCV